MILLFTDFGLSGPYVGQMHAVLAAMAPGVPVVDLMHDAPRCDPRAAAYLLAALVPEMPAGAICIGVVDPGVGTARPPVVLEAGGRRFVGPGNGLFEIVQRRAAKPRLWRIDWRPERLSSSFHGRDLFAPVAAILARGETPALGPEPDDRPGDDWPDDLAEIIHVDGFGNLVTGLRAERVPADATIEIAGQRVRRARVFAEAQAGTAFWYGNSSGLVEIAVNRASAAALLGIGTGTPVRPESEPDRGTS